MNTMKNKIKKGAFLFMLLLGSGACFTSCSDIMETESDRMLIDPSLDAQTDSVYYINGMLRGLQQLADQYVLLGEFRGDLLVPNSHTSEDLREVYNFTADASNAYDSAYVYYRVINNCNYFIAHRDTTLMTGADSTSLPEYAEAKAIRAWTYMQLAKTYGTVPFTLDPVVSISGANNVTETKDLQGIANALLPDLVKYSRNTAKLKYYTGITAGTTNDGNTKKVDVNQTILPVDLVIADLYLETNDYKNAAYYYSKFLIEGNDPDQLDPRPLKPAYPYSMVIPTETSRNIPNGMYNYMMSYGTYTWAQSIFLANEDPSNVITYIPMAVNKQKGTVSNLPKIFGYDYYTTNINTSDRYLVERMASPSPAFTSLVKSQTYYYPYSLDDLDNDIRSVDNVGDMRYYQTWIEHTDGDSAFSHMRKYQTSNIYIYRDNVVYLKLAEALNRSGYPDAAFMILKDGIYANASFIKSLSEDSVNAYVRDTTINLLTTTLPFLSNSKFDIENVVTSEKNVNGGIHSYGCGRTRGGYAPYNYFTEIKKKLSAMVEKGYNVPEPIDSIDFYGPYAQDAMEDIICDEMALESAYEGNRWNDLTRMATHKNNDSTYGSGYGDKWLTDKINRGVDFSVKSNWYLPIK